MTDYDAIIPAARDFYARLNADNTKAWWQEYKPEYDTRLKAPALALIDDIAGELQAIYGDPFKGKIFRPHRDVRFSKDKRPYNTHLHMLWSMADLTNGPGWFFGVSPDYMRIGWGWMGFTSEQVSAWRDAVVFTKIPALIGQMGGTLSEPELKRIPSGFEKDHPQGEHLRRKSLALWVDGIDTNIRGQIVSHFKAVQAVHRELTPLLT
ncbi:MAG: TIGR02453 family protein [Planktomarina sp.]